MGAISENFANSFVKRLHLFKEDADVSTLLLHGKNSHRLFFQALCESLKGSPYAHIEPAQILQLLIDVSAMSGGNLWMHLMDSLEDTITATESDSALKYDNYRYSCRSPFVFNSLVLCFGHEFGLRNLRHCMLDSHWKESDKMVRRLLEKRPLEKGVDSSCAYLAAIEAMVFNKLGILGGFPFTLSSEEASLDHKYKVHPQSKAQGKIKLKLIRGEVLSDQERKVDRFKILEDPSHFKPLLREEKSHGLMIEWMEQNKDGDSLSNAIIVCIEEFAMNAAVRPSGLKLLEKIFNSSAVMKTVSGSDTIYRIQGPFRKACYRLGLSRDPALSALEGFQGNLLNNQFS